MKRLTILLAAGALLIPATSAQAKSCGNGLTASGVSCSYAKSFQRGFANAPRGHNPYRVRYRGFKCNLSSSPTRAVTDCKRSSPLARIRWSVAKSSPHAASAAAGSRWRTCKNPKRIQNLLSYNDPCPRAERFARAFRDKLMAITFAPGDFPSIKFRTYYCAVAVDDFRLYPQCTKEGVHGKYIINWTQIY
jgi:hypothetical protein